MAVLQATGTTEQNLKYAFIYLNLLAANIILANLC